MNNKKLYLYLYYASLFVTALMMILLLVKSPAKYYNGEYELVSGFGILACIINVILVAVFTVLFGIRKKLDKVNILFPAQYILFTLIVLVLCHLFNNKLLIPYVHYSYYNVFILFNYTLLNIYSILSIGKKRRRKRK